ncbi:MAG: NYN domain-containing protein [Chloroflexi bacterium]|nr:NYN domain-containing protein [Chloroflexota bacterium]
MTQRVAVYIDGLNLYQGLKQQRWQRYYWLDLRLLSLRLLRADQQLVAVRYFTAVVRPVPHDADKPKRQGTYLEALATLPDLHIHYGYHLAKRRRCPHCGAIEQTYEEKMTDVNIAVELLGDAQDDLFDTALVISGDGDLAGPVRTIGERYPAKRAVVAFPPARHSAALRQAARGFFTISRSALRDSQFPDRVSNSDGYVLTRPSSWQ